MESLIFSQQTHAQRQTIESLEKYAKYVKKDSILHTIQDVWCLCCKLLTNLTSFSSENYRNRK